MMIDTITTVLEWLNIVLLFIVLLFSLSATKKLVNKESNKEINLIQKNVFVLLTWGIFGLFMATIVRNSYLIIGKNNFTFLIDILFSISYILFIIAFAYFWYRTAKFHCLEVKEKIFFVGMICVVLIWMLYLFRQIVITSGFEVSVMNGLLVLFNSLLISLMFLLTYAVHVRLKNGIIESPLGYISNGVFLYFIAYMLFTYINFNNLPTFVNLIDVVLLILSSAYYLLGFMIARLKCSYTILKSNIYKP